VSSTKQLVDGGSFYLFLPGLFTPVSLLCGLSKSGSLRFDAACVAFTSKGYTSGLREQWVRPHEPVHYFIVLWHPPHPTNSIYVSWASGILGMGAVF
jgi:hypothetical protein